MTFAMSVNPSRRRLTDLPIRRKLRLITLILLPAVVVLTATTIITIGILSGLRAYVAGESLYSKYQKDAVFYLERFVLHGRPGDYRRFEEAIRVPLGDGDARRELESADPDLDAVRRSFRQGKNDEADIPRMITVFRWLRHMPYFRDAVRLWAAADRKIDQLVEIARDAGARGTLSPSERASFLGQIERLNAELIVFENEFTETIGEGFRWATWMLIIALLVVDALILGTGSWMGNWIAGGITRQVSELTRGASAIARGDLSARVPQLSTDELGRLAEWFNEMAGNVEQAEGDLRRTLSILTTTLESTVEGILVLDLEGKVTAFNGQLLDIWRIDASRIARGTPIEELLPLAEKLGDPEGALARFREILADPESDSQDLLEFLDGRLVERHSRPQREEGRSVGRVFSFRDVTARKRVEEELLRSNRDLEQFAYVASHDLQEPLRTMASYVGLLRRRYEGKLDSDADEYIRFVTDGALRMQALIRDLLQFSRVGSRGRPFERIETDEVLASTLAQLEATIAASGATVTHDPLPAVFADRLHVGQLLQNLIANAIKFRGEAPPLVHVSSTTNGREHVFSVKDNGIGIAPEFHDRIFVVFQRLHPIGTYEGTGIGLALCKKIVERHGGRIWMESREGAGATFRFTLPRVD